MSARTLALVALALAAAGCSGGQLTAAGTPTIAAASTPFLDPDARAEQLADQAGCRRSTDMPDRPLFIAAAKDCLDRAWTIPSQFPDSFPDEAVAFYVFNNNEGRDAWLHTAATFGDRGVIKGDRWAVEIPDKLPHLDQVAQTIAGRLHGQRVL